MPKIYHTPQQTASAWRSAAWLALLGWLIALIARNLQSLREGIGYLRQMRGWRPADRTPLDPDGPFGSCYPLVQASNAGRHDYLRAALSAAGLAPTAIPVPGEALPNLLVRLGPPGPCLLFVAHYDKSREDRGYEGASDNTAAVAVLLRAAQDLAYLPVGRPVGFLFTAAEERGCLGAQAFIAYAQHEPLPIAAVINFDMLGRGRIASRPSAMPGFYFRLPLLGEFVFDGRRVRRGEAYPPPDPALLQSIRQHLGPALVNYERFTARSDSNWFQAAGIPTVSLSSDDIYYLDLVWERDADQVDLLDQRHLAQARQLILSIAGKPASH
jgi:Peptidase family M28